MAKGPEPGTTATALPGFDTPAAGTEAPLEMLAACHGRMERHLALLERLGAHLADHGHDGQARDAAAQLLRYFDRAAPDHHADEERDLFPALLESMAGSDPVCLRELTASLSDDHRRLEAGWRPLRTLLQRIADGEPEALDPAAAQAWVADYRRHLAREDAELLPMAARLLDDDAIVQVGRAMRERRGIPPV